MSHTEAGHRRCQRAYLLLPAFVAGSLYRPLPTLRILAELLVGGLDARRVIIEAGDRGIALAAPGRTSLHRGEARDGLVRSLYSSQLAKERGLIMDML